ncbi:MAG: hypothetical protein ACXVZV_04210 [Terriglobales bacterium]
MRNVIVFLLLATAAVGQMRPGVDQNGVYQNGELGFSFVPPSGMRDVTAKAADPSAAKDPNAIQLVFFALSGPNSNELDWRAFAVQSFPRSRVSAGSDFEAETRLARTVIGNSATETDPPKKVTIGDRTYALSQFQRVHGAVTEYSNVYTTMVRDQMVAFVFNANSLANLDDMGKVLKTVKVKPE